MNIKNLFRTFLLFITQFVVGQKTFIIVPGTWSQTSLWHRPGSDFFEALATGARYHNARVITFMWSGKNSHKARIAAAKELAKLIMQHKNVHLVTHSHGSNVGILASQFLPYPPNKKPHIKHFFALATPVSTSHYLPNMDAIEHFYNLFSYNDTIQTVFGIFERTFPKHERIINLRVTIDGTEPTHTSIHDKLIARWLPFLPELLKQQECDFEAPGKMHFSTHELPKYEVDQEQLFLAEHEAERARQHLLALRSIREKNT